MKYKIWNGTDSLVTPVDEVLTAEQVIARYPAAALPDYKYIICDTKQQLGVFMEFDATKERYKKLGANITEVMTDQEVLDAMDYLDENQPVPLPVPEERSAAAAEFSNILQMPDKTKKVAASEESLKIIQSNVDKGLWSEPMIDVVSAKGMIDSKQKTDLKAKVIDLSKEK